LDYLKQFENFKKLPDILSKSLFYQSIFNLTRDSRISSLEYIDIIKGLIVHEQDDHIISNCLATLSGIVHSYIPLKYYSKYAGHILNLVLSLLQIEGLTNDSIKTLISTVIDYSRSEEQINFIKSWLSEGPHIVIKENEKKKFSDSFLTQDLRFKIVLTVHKSRTIHDDEKQKLLEVEIEKDKNSDRSVRARHYCDAARPDKENKKKLWNKFVNESNSDTLHNIGAAMGEFASRDQLDLVEEYLTEKFFTDSPGVAKKVEHFYLDQFLSHCSPKLFINEEMIAKLEKLAFDNKDIDTLYRKLSEMVDDMKRFLKAHKLCEEYEKDHKDHK